MLVLLYTQRTKNIFKLLLRKRSHLFITIKQFQNLFKHEQIFTYARAHTNTHTPSDLFYNIDYIHQLFNEFET
jgi:hypothetical protein